jgi:hypothetical protein
MRYRPEHKAEVRQKIVKDASHRVRAEGLSGAAVAAVMPDTGLTHGGFYKHFGSKRHVSLNRCAASSRSRSLSNKPVLLSESRSFTRLLAWAFISCPRRCLSVTLPVADARRLGENETRSANRNPKSSTQVQVLD